MEAIVHLRYYAPWDRLYVNPSAGLEYLRRPNARAKLARLAEAARKAQEIMFHE